MVGLELVRGYTVSISASCWNGSAESPPSCMMDVLNICVFCTRYIWTNDSVACSSRVMPGEMEMYQATSGIRSVHRHA